MAPPPSEVSLALAIPASANLEGSRALHVEEPIIVEMVIPVGADVVAPVGANLLNRPDVVQADPLALRPQDVVQHVDVDEGPQVGFEVQRPQVQQPDAPIAQEEDPVDLFLNFLEGNMADVTSNKMVCAPECFDGTDVGEGVPSKQVMILNSFSSTIIEADDEELRAQGLIPYPHAYLATQHILTLTKSLATMHAQVLATNKNCKLDQEFVSNSLSKNSGTDMLITKEEKNTAPELPITQPECNQIEVLKDRWTAQVTQVKTVDINMDIVVDVLKHANSSPRTIKKLEALRSDLPTLTQFLQFASSIQTRLVPCIGPIGINDIYLNENEEGETISMAVRLRTRDEEMKGPFLRDISWIWLTLLQATTLSDRYMELCNEYCTSFNKTYSHLLQSGDCEEISYFDVMRDLGENFLHSFLTIIHKFVSSNTWFFDRRLHTTDGLNSLVDIFSFLVDNGIVGSIFVM